MRHLVEVVKLDSTDVPPTRATAKLFIIEGSELMVAELADRISAHCSGLPDGDDYDVAYTTLDEVDVMTKESAESWLLTFGVESIFDQEEDE